LAVAVVFSWKAITPYLMTIRQTPTELPPIAGVPRQNGYRHSPFAFMIAKIPKRRGDP